MKYHSLICCCIATPPLPLFHLDFILLPMGFLIKNLPFWVIWIISVLFCVETHCKAKKLRQKFLLLSVDTSILLFYCSEYNLMKYESQGVELSLITESWVPARSNETFLSSASRFCDGSMIVLISTQKVEKVIRNQMWLLV